MGDKLADVFVGEAGDFLVVLLHGFFFAVEDFTHCGKGVHVVLFHDGKGSHQHGHSDGVQGQDGTVQGSYQERRQVRERRLSVTTMISLESFRFAMSF